VQAGGSPADTIAAALPAIAEALVALAIAGNTTAIALSFKLSGEFEAVDWQLLDDAILAASDPRAGDMRADLAAIIAATATRILAQHTPPPIVATNRPASRTAKR
jgi:hypothetical protein